MRFRVFAFLLVILALGVAGWGVFLLLKKDRKAVVIDIPAYYLETVDTSRYRVLPFQVSRFDKEDSVIVRFPKGAARYGLFMYDSLNYMRILAGEHNVNPMSQNDLSARLMGVPQINLSGFNDGTYYAHLTQCNFHGYFAFELRTLKMPSADTIKK